MSYPKKGVKADTTRSKKTDQQWNKEKDKAYGQQKRNQLQMLLEGKFKTKYANEAKDAKIEELITKEVEKFIKTAKLTEPNLNKLDEHIASLIKERYKKPVQGPSPESKKEADSPEKPTEIFAACSQNLGKEKGGKSAKGDQLFEDNWAQIAEYNRRLHDEEEKRHVEKKMEQKNKLKNELDRQIEEKKKMQESLRNKEKEAEDKQVKMETELEIIMKVKELKRKEDLAKQKKEAKRIFESIYMLYYLNRRKS